MSDATPAVSILLPARNAARTLPMAIESCLAQTLPDFELLLLDHDSQDGTFSLMKKYARRDHRIKVLHAPAGSGFVTALNFGWKEAAAPLIARMDADDFAYPARLQHQVRLLNENPDLAACGTLVRIRRRKSDLSTTEPREGYAEYEKWLNSVVTPEDIAAQRFVDSPVANPSTLVRREVFEILEGYRDHPWAEDYDFWLRLLGTGRKIGKVDQLLLDWHDSANRATRKYDRYSQDNFIRAKAHYLACLPQVQEKGISLCGAGPIGKKLATALQEAKAEIHAFYEVNPKRIGEIIRDIPVKSQRDLADAYDTVVIGAVGQPGKREHIRHVVQSLGFQEGEDFFCAA